MWDGLFHDRNLFHTDTTFRADANQIQANTVLRQVEHHLVGIGWIVVNGLAQSVHYRHAVQAFGLYGDLAGGGVGIHTKVGIMFIQAVSVNRDKVMDAVNRHGGS